MRYTVRLHVVGEDRRDDDSVRGTDRYAEIRVVTPLGEFRAAALAASHFATVEPKSVFREIDTAEVEHDFTIVAEDIRDSESFGR